MSLRLTDQDFGARLLYRDGLILVIDKPSGIPVHAAGKKLHHLGHYFHLLQFGLKNPPALAHRLDRGTSGCLALVRNTSAARKMQMMFSKGLIKKTYIAVVHGQIATNSGQITMPLAKFSDDKSCWRMKVDPTSSLSAVTDYVVISKTPHASVVELTPHTGRTHQLRVHCQHLGHSIIGDNVYGNDKGGLLHLHAHSIEIPLYKNKPAIVVKAPLPPHMASLIASLENP